MAAKSIVVIGGGIIGTTTAYYLSRHPKFSPDVKVHIIEASSVAAGASGKAGGFIARDWHGAPTKSLAALSFDLHQELSDEHNGVEKWGYRRVTTLQVNIGTARKPFSVSGAPWITGATSSDIIGTTDSTAQVTPDLFTKSIASLAQERGVQVTIATVDGIKFNDDSSKPSSVQATTDEGEQISIPCTDVLFAAGPWTATLAKKLLGKRASAALDIEPSPCSTSVIFRPDAELTAHVLFTEMKTPEGIVSPEVYVRADGTVYMCGDHSDPLRQRALTEKATDATPSDIAVKHHTERLAMIGNRFTGASIVSAQACFRPESKRRVPIIGKLHEGIWIASGHSVWGICNGPGTGKLMAELLLDGEATSADIRRLEP